MIKNGDIGSIAAVCPRQTAGMQTNTWQSAPFTKHPQPILGPDAQPQFTCPVSGQRVRWAEKDIFNPAAGVKDGLVHLLVRAEDTVGRFKGVSRIGLATSRDGVHFELDPEPVIFPALDAQLAYEHDGGCEDPRLMLRDDGTWICTYSAFNGTLCHLCVATSRDLRTWTKHGPAFSGTTWEHHWSKSGALLGRWQGDQLVMTRVNGTYWMYWGEGVLFAATSDDGIAWKPLTMSINDHRLITLDQHANYQAWANPGTPVALRPLAHPRPGRFDHHLVEPGPAAVLGDHGIVLWYNGAQPGRDAGRYACGQMLFDGDCPTAVMARPANPILEPDQAWELTGQNAAVTFGEGLVRFQGKTHLYYGCADSRIGLATTPY